MGIIDTNFTMPGNDSPPQTFKDLKTQQGQINWLAQFLMSVNNVFNNVSGSVTTLAEDQSAYVEIDFNDEDNTATFDFYLPRGYRGYPGSMENATATAQTLAPGSSATVSVALDQPTQSLAFSFGLPEGTPATDAQTANAVAAWIEAHPEAVTTVQDGAVSTVKLADGAVTFAKLASDVKAILAGKADLVSYAPLLTAGVAESLLSGDEQTATFAQRVSEGASVGVHAILGNTEVVGNDLVSVNIEGVKSTGKNILPNTATTQTINGVTFTVNPDKTITANGTAGTNGANYPIFVSNNTNGFFQGARLSGCPSDGGNNRYILRFSNVITSSVTDIGNGVLINIDTTGRCNIAISIYEGVTVNNLLFKPQIEFNDTSTEYEPYKLISERAIDVANYFPDGMRGAGTAHDELRRNKAIMRMGDIDLGTLNWSYSTDATGGYFYTIVNDAKQASSNTTPGNIICDNYQTVAANNVQNGDIAISGANKTVFVRDSSYSDAATFKTAMSGVMLYYELATSTETAINPPINMDYATQQGGTEQIVIPEGEQSAAPTFVYVQGYDADGVADKALSVIAAIEGATASTNYAIGSYFVHDGKLYKATSAIASGESITPGTNCTQTTIMAEILALA